MARLPRITLPGVPLHIIQRGNNRQPCFASKQDLAAYAHWLDKYSRQFSVSIHAWVFMTNHVHLLATPSEVDGVSNMMQSLGRRYVRYFNHEYRRTGTLWEGRFRSCLVQTENYLLVCQRYIELNPVRANRVSDPAEYAWSSYRCNALGLVSQLCSPHEEYLRLGKTKKDRQLSYQSLFKTHIKGELLQKIQNSIHSGITLGNNRFKDKIEALCGQRARPAKMGRPPSHLSSCVTSNRSKKWGQMKLTQ